MMIETKNDFLEEIKKLRKWLAITEKELMKCCNENKELRKKLAKKKIREVKSKSKNPIYI